SIHKHQPALTRFLISEGRQITMIAILAQLGSIALQHRDEVCLGNRGDVGVLPVFLFDVWKTGLLKLRERVFAQTLKPLRFVGASARRRLAKCLFILTYCYDYFP